MIDANPHYASVRFPNGRESNVSLHDLAPVSMETPVGPHDSSGTPDLLERAEEAPVVSEDSGGVSLPDDPADVTGVDATAVPPDTGTLRRSGRVRKPAAIFDL